jgi:hypothetical protein
MLTKQKANLTIEDITMKNFWGTVSKKYDPRAGTLVCSAPNVRLRIPHETPTN